MTDEKTIVTRNLVKQFKTRNGVVTAINGVTLQVHRGETYGLIGRTARENHYNGSSWGADPHRGESSILGYDSMHEPIRSESVLATSRSSLPSLTLP
jgi:hypothetical protein